MKYMSLEPRDIFLDVECDHFECKLYCRFMFWKKHPVWYQKRRLISYKNILKELKFNIK